MAFHDEVRELCGGVLEERLAQTKKRISQLREKKQRFLVNGARARIEMDIMDAPGIIEAVDDAPVRRKAANDKFMSLQQSYDDAEKEIKRLESLLPILENLKERFPS
jgi:hypothetical protein